MEGAWRAAGGLQERRELPGGDIWKTQGFGWEWDHWLVLPGYV